MLSRGCMPHQEDEWLGGVIQIGPEVRLHVMARDPRCAIVTLDPTTGQRTIDTLRLILGFFALTPKKGFIRTFGEALSRSPQRRDSILP